MRLPTTTMISVVDHAQGTDIVDHILRGEWFIQDLETPACGTVLYVPADQTNDGVERMFVCDLPASHPDRHRQVTDMAEGTTLTWGSDATPSPAEPNCEASDG